MCTNFHFKCPMKEMTNISTFTKDSFLPFEYRFDTNMATKLAKIVIVEELFSGKTEFIRAVSEIGVLPYHIEFSTPEHPQGITWGLDFGRILVDDDFICCLLGGPPTARRFDIRAFQQDTIAKDLLGFVVLIHKDQPETAKQILEAIQTGTTVPYIVAINLQDNLDGLDLEDLRTRLYIENNVKIVPCHVKDKESVKAVLLELLDIVPQTEIIERLIAKIRKI